MTSEVMKQWCCEKSLPNCRISAWSSRVNSSSAAKPIVMRGDCAMRTAAESWCLTAMKAANMSSGKLCRCRLWTSMPTGVRVAVPQLQQSNGRTRFSVSRTASWKRSTGVAWAWP
ncbi:hypothetical protein D3C76_1188630 [compost metagenome]